MSPYFSKIHMTGMFDKCHDYIARGLERQFSEVELGKTHVDIVEFYGELYQFFLGALGFDLDCNYVSDNAKFHNEVSKTLLEPIKTRYVTGYQPIRTRYLFCLIMILLHCHYAYR